MDVRATTQQIFDLRREKKLDEALQLARPLYSACSSDPWVVKALGWTLYDCIKRDQTAGKLEEAGNLASELQQLGITEETDEILFKMSELILKTLTPEFKELAAAKELSKSGQYVAAANVLRETVKKYPDSSEAKTSLGWELYKLLHVEADLTPSIELMRDYCRLKLNTKPDKLHSLFLSEACKRAEKWTDFGKFVEWWKTDFLSAEDWQERFGADGSGPYPSLAVKLATALYRNAKLFHKRGTSHQWILPFVRKVVETTNSDWTPYYLARMTVWFEADLTGVKDAIAPLVKAKQNEFWAWQALADCTTNSNEKTAYYARAVLSTAGDEDYKVDLYHQFALFLAQTNQHELASQVARRHIGIQAKKDKQPARDIAEMQQAAWFDNQSKDDLTERLKPAAEEATRYLFKSAPWTSANFIEVRESQDGRPPLTILLLADKGYCKLKKRCASSVRPERGAPISVKLFWPPMSTKPLKPGDPPPGPPLGIIVDWEPRCDGVPYDCAKKYWAVVTYIDTNKGAAKIAVSSRLVGFIHFSEFPNAHTLTPGDVITIWTNDLQNTKETIVHMLNYNTTIRCPVKGLYQEFEGQICIRAGNPFGFVKGSNDIHVSPNLVLRHHLSDNQQIRGWALYEWNKKRAQPGWNALIIEEPEVLPEKTLS